MYRFLLYASNIIYKKCLSFWTAFFVSKEKIAPSLVSSLIAGLVSSMQCFLFIFLEKKKRPELKLNDEAKYVQSRV